jgi:tetratricopeptide (TPR) repeat protein
MIKVGRNDVCLCGSGKKYKKCCGKTNVISLENLIGQEVDRLQDRIIEYALSHHELALKSYIMERIGNFELDEEDHLVFTLFVMNWALFTQPLVNGKTVVEQYIDTYASCIERSQIKAVLESWRDTIPSISRIIKKENENTVMVEDIFSKERTKVKILEQDRQLELGSLVVGQLVSMGSVFTFFKTFIEFPEDKADQIIDTIRALYEKEKSASPEKFMTAFFPEILYSCFQEVVNNEFEINQLDWKHPSHQMTAARFLVMFNEREGLEALANIGVMLWHMYCEKRNPQIRKPELYAAALHYLLMEEFMPFEFIKQKEIAEYYGVSSSSLSAKYRELEDVLDEELDELHEKMYDEEQKLLQMTAAPNALFTAEHHLHQIERALEEKEFSSIEEINEYLNAIIHNIPMSSRPLSKKAEAQELLYDAFEEPNRKKRLELVHKALSIYPNSPDAYNILGEEAGTLEEALTWYKKGVEAGEKELGKKFFAENAGHFWGLIETRPYMRAKENYARTLWEMGKKEKVVEQYEEMLRLNPNDNQGVRYLLTSAYLALKQYEKAETLMKQYDEPTAHVMYSKLFLSYMKQGINDVTKRVLDEAIDSNPHVIDYLLKKKKLPRHMPAYYGFGDESEAIIYVMENGDLWWSEPKLLEWLQKMTK